MSNAINGDKCLVEMSSDNLKLEYVTQDDHHLTWYDDAMQCKSMFMHDVKRAVFVWKFVFKSMVCRNNKRFALCFGFSLKINDSDTSYDNKPWAIIIWFIRSILFCFFVFLVHYEIHQNEQQIITEFDFS